MRQLPPELLENDIDFPEGAPLQASDGESRRILAGVRPSGRQHIGHYKGSLGSWKNFQKEGVHSDFLIADIHALADHPDRPDFVRQNVLEVATDWLALGLDPQKANFFVQTGVPELESLTALFATMVTVARHERNPTLKREMEVLRSAGGRDLTVAFYTYPVSQAADILGPLGDLVPVGQDQRPMLELTREIARSFNLQYGNRIGFQLPVPQVRVGEVGRLVGTDGKEKMSKSVGNDIGLAESARTLRQKVNGMASPNKGKSDPGTVEGHVVFQYLDAFFPDKAGLQMLKQEYERGGVGEGTLKQMLLACLEDFIAPIRESRAEWEKRPNDVKDILRQGTTNVRARVQETHEKVREAMQLGI